MHLGLRLTAVGTEEARVTSLSSLSSCPGRIS